MGVMSAHTRTAALGAMVGWTLGAQNAGRKGFRKLSFYDPIPPRMPSSDALEAWLVWSRHLRSGQRPEALGASLLASWNYPVDESVFGLANVSRGLSSPISGSFSNPLSGGSRAIGRAVYWGIALHGKPDDAAEYAYYDASIDHDKEGVWVAVAFARTLAQVTPGMSFSDFVRALMDGLPKESKVLTAVSQVLKSLDSPDGAREVREALPAKLGITDHQDAVLTAAWALLGLAHGHMELEPSLLVCAGCGGAAGHSTMVVGAVAAMASGDVPVPWSKPVGESFVCGHGLRGIEPPSKVEGFLDLIESDAQNFSFVEPVAAEVATEATAPVAVRRTQPLSERMRELLTAEQNTTTVVCGDSIVGMQYLSPPVARSKETLKMTLTIKNVGEEEASYFPTFAAPKGWEVAHKIGEFKLLPGMVTSFAIVVRPMNETGVAQSVVVKVGDDVLRFPVLAPQLWYSVGPMQNQEGTGFDREYPAEKNIKLGQVFNGRSNLPVEWTAYRTGSAQFDVEKLFGAGPGTVYFFAHVRFANPGKFRIVVASGVGAIVWVDDHKLYWYHDTHTPVPRVVEPYVGYFESAGETRILIKTFRNLAPVPPMTVYFLAEDGSLAVPTEFLPIA